MGVFHFFGGVWRFEEDPVAFDSLFAFQSELFRGRVRKRLEFWLEETCKPAEAGLQIGI
jgi:hypothetical protein